MLSVRFAQRNVSKFRTSFRFHNQMFDWTFKDLDYYSDSFLGGLQENRMAPGSTILTWLDDKHGAETVTAMVGALKNGSQTVSLQGLLGGSPATPETLRKAVESVNPSLFLVSPNQMVDNQLKHALVSLAFPEAQKTGKTGNLAVSSAPNLRFIVQTGFYHRPGFVRFRDFCVYVPPTMKQLERQDFAKVLDACQSSAKGWPAVGSEDHVYLLSALDRQELVLRALFETVATGSFLDFVGKETVAKSDFAFVNELPGHQRSFLVGPSAVLDSVRPKVKHTGVNYVPI